jgi:hypothetical protein
VAGLGLFHIRPGARLRLRASESNPFMGVCQTAGSPNWSCGLGRKGGSACRCEPGSHTRAALAAHHVHFAGPPYLYGPRFVQWRPNGPATRAIELESVVFRLDISLSVGFITTNGRFAEAGSRRSPTAPESDESAVRWRWYTLAVVFRWSDASDRKLEVF